MGRKPESSFKAGMYLLETLTSGMYNEPLSIYREYIQNAVDSLDMIRTKSRRGSLEIRIDLNPKNRTITIRDSGIGLSASNAEQILSTIGSSSKSGSGLRGFRGIGRLGGIAFSEKAVFCTKAEGEVIESIQEWNCRELRRLLGDPDKASMKLRDVFKRITSFEQRNSKKHRGSYFEVMLEGVSSFRNHLFDIQKVRNYLSEVAPVPFNPSEFSYARKLSDYLSCHVNNYGAYDIVLNGEPIFKPYRNQVKVTKKGSNDHIDDVELFEIKIGGQFVACGWFGQRRELLGAIAKGDISSGIKVRIGNLLLGDGHLLDRCFREPRFNGYLIGEIHVDCPELIPNSRRDDFIDNDMKTLFYNSVERQIGLPLSKRIRLRSRTSSESKKTNGDRSAQEKDVSLISVCYQKETDGKECLAKYTQSKSSSALKNVFEPCRGCSKLNAILFKLRQKYSLRRSKKVTLPCSRRNTSK